MISGTFTLTSTLDRTGGLLSKYTYDETKSDLPIVVMIHGFNLTIDAITQTIMNRIANQGYFVVAIGMRGRKGAGGSRDASIRELHDIFDGINHIKTNFPVSNKVIVSGYSGGGGNALAFATKFPYVANTIVNHFGMIDYGFHNIESWYMRNPSYQSDIQQFVGRFRNTENLLYYRTRNSHEALSNVKSRIFNYHDSEDTGVSVNLTHYLRNELDRLGKPHTTKISTSSSSTRYLHNMNVSVLTESDWLPYGKDTPALSHPDSDTLKVMGYVTTNRFKCLLNNLDNGIAELTYNLNTNQFTINPISSNTLTVSIIQGNLHDTRTITGQTTFTFNGVTIPEGDESIGSAGTVNKYFIKQSGAFDLIHSLHYKQNNVWERIRF